MKYYAGIGSRKTPQPILEQMKNITIAFEKRGWCLRSGCAAGADSAFADFVYEKELWIPFDGFNGYRQASQVHIPSEQHYEIASTLLPYWKTIKRQSVKDLHARNVGQILGDLKSPKSQFVVCWTPDGCESEDAVTEDTGGTKTAIILAHRNEIPVINMKNKGWADRLKEILNDK
jgi:hypothetical protein